MDAGLELRELLRNRSRPVSSQDLPEPGTQRVRVIDPATLEELILANLPRFAEQAGFVPLDRVEEMVRQGTAELRHLLHSREAEVVSAREQLAELEDLRRREQELAAELDRFREEATSRSAPAGQAAPAGQGTADPALAERLLTELSSLKQSFESMGRNMSAASTGNDGSLAARLQELAENLGKRLERMNRAGGSSGAGEGEPELRLDSLFSRDLEKEMETNMADVGVKNRDGKSISDSLERMKKLRGSG